MKGIVINLHSFGATVRLETGELTTALLSDVQAHSTVYERALAHHTPIEFERRGAGKRAPVILAPQIYDEHLDAQITAYLKSAEERDNDVPAHERHFLNRKKRAELFQSRPTSES